MRNPSPEASAVLSMPGSDTEERIMPLPNSAVAAATVAPPPGSKFCKEPTGAHSTGRRNFLPKRLRLQSTFDTSRNTRGRKPSESSASRLRQRRFALRAADQVVPVVAIEVLPRDLDEFVKVLEAELEDLVRHRRGDL